ncbi:MAG: hypothetical protein KZQ83_02275 [gamma proteobacterium symbiont of Taylorina sp.]|nr:hypothetical protein [gamma proteobacterium symbiont of Taylorina sp.]
MAITNIESTGFNSLFLASERLGRQAVDANVPTQKEKNLNSANRSLKSENTSLNTENRLLTEENLELTKNNQLLSRQVDLSQAENLSEKRKNLDDIGSDLYNSLGKGENPSKNSADLATKNTSPEPADVATQPAVVPQAVSYNASSELLTSPVSGSSFNLQV